MGGMIACLLLLTASFAGAQACRGELLGALGDRSLEAPPTGADAARVLKRAVELVEPALPALVRGGSGPVNEGDPIFTAANYLLERQLLPGDWNPDELNQGTWEAMLTAFLAWYHLPLVNGRPVSTVKDLIDSAAQALEAVSGAIRPAALLATDPKRAGRATFFAVIWNWTVYPRLLVVRPGDDDPGDPRAVMERLSNCAVRVKAYISAPEATAARLFLSHNTSRMLVVGGTPDSGDDWPLRVPEGLELSAFRYALPDLEALDLYAAVFEGPSVGIGTLLTLLPRIRTNISPFNLGRYLETP